jgi:hypothetical protein
VRRRDLTGVESAQDTDEGFLEDIKLSVHRVWTVKLHMTFK